MGIEYNISRNAPSATLCSDTRDCFFILFSILYANFFASYLYIVMDKI
jgi:hypothetical protein